MSSSLPFSHPDHPDNVDLLAFVRASVGERVRIDDASRHVGRLSVVWRLTGPDGLVGFVKRHEEAKLYDRETHAYDAWIPQLRGVPGVHLPEVIARDDDLGAVVLTALADVTPVEDLAAEGPGEQAHHAAGRLLRALHDLPTEGGVEEGAALMRDLITRYVLPAEGRLDAALFDWIVASLDGGRPFEGLPVVCAHSDYSPRNWTMTSAGTISVFDWERAQKAVWVMDVTRMEFDVWPEHPALRDAFFAGYGLAPTERDRRQVHLAVLMHAVGSVTWAEDRGDMEFAALARGAIERLRRGGI